MADAGNEKQAGRTSTSGAAKKASSQRIAAQRAAHRRAERKRNILIAGGIGLAVVVVIGAIVAIGLNSKKKTPSAAHPVVAASSTVLNGLRAAAALTTPITSLSAISGPPKQLNGAALTGTDGKPRVLYIGAEFCPYCAVTRWPLVVALSRFGTFSGLQTTYSAADDTAGPNTPTLSLRAATYQSSYLDFTAVEDEDGSQQPLQTPTAADSQLWMSLNGGQFPFIDFGGKWMQSGALEDPSTLAGMSPDQVGGEIADPTTKVGGDVTQGADLFTGIICGLDGGKPANVCTAPGVTTATAALSAAK